MPQTIELRRRGDALAVWRTQEASQSLPSDLNSAIETGKICE